MGYEEAQEILRKERVEARELQAKRDRERLGTVGSLIKHGSTEELFDLRQQLVTTIMSYDEAKLNFAFRQYTKVGEIAAKNQSAALKLVELKHKAMVEAGKKDAASAQRTVELLAQTTPARRVLTTKDYSNIVSSDGGKSWPSMVAAVRKAGGSKFDQDLRNMGKGGLFAGITDSGKATAKLAGLMTESWKETGPSYLTYISGLPQSSPLTIDESALIQLVKTEHFISLHNLMIDKARQLPGVSAEMARKAADISMGEVYPEKEGLDIQKARQMHVNVVALQMDESRNKINEVTDWILEERPDLADTQEYKDAVKMLKENEVSDPKQWAIDMSKDWPPGMEEDRNYTASLIQWIDSGDPEAKQKLRMAEVPGFDQWALAVGPDQAFRTAKDYPQAVAELASFTAMAMVNKPNITTDELQLVSRLFISTLADRGRVKIDKGRFGLGFQGFDWYTNRIGKKLGFTEDDAREAGRAIGEYHGKPVSDKMKFGLQFSDFMSSRTRGEDAPPVDTTTTIDTDEAAADEAPAGVLTVPEVGESVASDTPEFDTYLNKMIKKESAWDPLAKNPRSSAGGLGQFMNDTWLGMLKNHRPDLLEFTKGDGTTHTVTTARRNPDGTYKDPFFAEVEKLKYNPALNMMMLRLFTIENAAGFRASGIPITEGTLYLAHFLGLKGARGVLADPDKRISDRIVKQNPNKRNEDGTNFTGHQMKDWADGSMAERTGEIPKSFTNRKGVEDPVYDMAVPQWTKLSGEDVIVFDSITPKVDETEVTGPQPFDSSVFPTIGEDGLTMTVPMADGTEKELDLDRMKTKQGGTLTIGRSEDGQFYVFDGDDVGFVPQTLEQLRALEAPDEAPAPTLPDEGPMVITAPLPGAETPAPQPAAPQPAAPPAPLPAGTTNRQGLERAIMTYPGEGQANYTGDPKRPGYSHLKMLTTIGSYGQVTIPPEDMADAVEWAKQEGDGFETTLDQVKRDRLDTVGGLESARGGGL